MNEEIKPCPKCHRKPKIQPIDTEGIYVQIYCNLYCCGWPGYSIMGFKEECIKAWNKLCIKEEN